MGRGGVRVRVRLSNPSALTRDMPGADAFSTAFVTELWVSNVVRQLPPQEQFWGLARWGIFAWCSAMPLSYINGKILDHNAAMSV